MAFAGNPIMGFSCVGDFNYLFITMQISLCLISQVKGGTKVTGEGGDGRLRQQATAAQAAARALRGAGKGRLAQVQIRGRPHAMPAVSYSEHGLWGALREPGPQESH